MQMKFGRTREVVTSGTFIVDFWHKTAFPADDILQGVIVQTSI